MGDCCLRRTASVGNQSPGGDGGGGVKPDEGRTHTLTATATQRLPYSLIKRSRAAEERRGGGLDQRGQGGRCRPDHRPSVVPSAGPLEFAAVRLVHPGSSATRPQTARSLARFGLRCLVFHHFCSFFFVPAMPTALPATLILLICFP